MGKITQNDIALGKRIKRERKKAGISQEKLGALIHLTQTHISLVETGRRRPSMDTLKKISRAINIKVKDLINF